MFDTSQKKLLEKMYARVFETSSSAKGKVPELTEEGQVLIARANIKVADLMPKTLDDFVKQHGGIQKTVEWLYSSVQLHLPETQSALVTADLATIEKTADRFMELVKVLHPLRVTAYEKQKNFKGAMARLRPVYMAALRAEAGTQLYSDANSTLRVTFAQVQGYSPREAIQYDPFTTLRGILEKHTGVEPFDVSAEQQQAIRALHSTPSEKPWVRNGTVPVNFLSDCDTTGGNSGGYGIWVFFGLDPSGGSRGPGKRPNLHC